MFKFNFGNEDVNSEKEEPRTDAINWYECKRVEIGLDMIEKWKNPKEEEIIKLNYKRNVTIACLSPSRIISKLKNEPGNTISNILQAEKNHSDLVPGKYEGGMKVWECTRDLVNYLAVNLTGSFLGKCVLDLGCGAGVLGIFCALKGALVTFQDYNHEVIELITIPNVFLNVKESNEHYHKVEFFSGDWGSLPDCMMQKEKSLNKEKPSLKKTKLAGYTRQFDYILSSETIYNCDNYCKIYRIIKDLMKDDGVCYISAKKYYFGVGGNTHSFIEYMKRGNVFNAEISWSSDEGVAREILKITFKSIQK